MKRKFTKSTFLQSIVSLAILSVFAYMALSYAGTSQQKRKLPDGRWEIAKNFGNGKTSVTSGHVDKYGSFEGMVTVRYERNYEYASTEEVNMKSGLRQGTAKVTYNNGSVRYLCFEDNVVVFEGRCEEKKAMVEDQDSTAYSTLEHKVPWFTINLEAFGYDKGYMKSFLDTLELILNENNVTADNFGDLYDNTIENLQKTPYDSIINLNNQLSIYNGMDLILRHQFRLATFDAYLRGDSNTYNVIKATYPNYLLTLNKFEVTESDFKGFCQEYDSILAAYPKVALNDTFIIDTLDNRIFTTLNLISEEEESSLLASLKSANLDLDFEYFSVIRNFIKDKTPTEVSDVVLSTILLQFINGDYIRQAVFDAFSMKNKIVRLPQTSIKIGNISSTSCTLVGNVINEGGATVTRRGITWATYFNPAGEGNLETADSGSGEFSVTINGLTPGTTYFARSYATNSAGTYFGNCVEFTSLTTGVEDLINPEMDLVIYPNPFSRNINIEICLETVQDVELVVINMQGQVVFNKKYHGLPPGQNNLAVDLFEYDEGIYTCKIIADEKESSRQLLKIKN